MDNEELLKIMKESDKFVDELKDKCHDQYNEIQELKEKIEDLQMQRARLEKQVDKLNEKNLKAIKCLQEENETEENSKFKMIINLLREFYYERNGIETTIKFLEEMLEELRGI